MDFGVPFDARVSRMKTTPQHFRPPSIHATFCTQRLNLHEVDEESGRIYINQRNKGPPFSYLTTIDSVGLCLFVLGCSTYEASRLGVATP